MATIEMASGYNGPSASSLDAVEAPPLLIPRSSPLPAAVVRWHRSESEQLATVICKGTFVLAPGRLRLAKVQDDVVRGGRNGFSSDIAPLKPRVDVVLRGSVFAPDRVPAESVVATLAIATVRKSVTVYCDRGWRDDGVLEYGEPFLRSRLSYERAAGGEQSWNPVGIRFDEMDARGRQRVPNIQPPGVALTSPETRFLPTGFGAIPETWDLRRARLASAEAATSWWSRPLAGFDFSYFNAAPSDQQLVCVRDDETIILEHLHAEHAILSCELPGLRARVRVGGVEGDDVTLSIDTIAIDTDRATVAITWRAVVVASPSADFATATIEIDKAELPATRPPQRTEPGALDGTDEITAVTRVLRDGPAASPMAPALPFRPSAQPDAPNERSSQKTMMLDAEAILAAWKNGPHTVYPPPGSEPAPQRRVPSSPPPPNETAPMPSPGMPAPARNVTLLPGQTIGQQSVMHGARPPSSRPPPLSFAPQALSMVELDARIASDAAADPYPAPGSIRQVDPRSEDPRFAPQGDALQVLWFDPASVKRLRVEYKPVIERLQPAPFDSSVATLFDSPKELQAQLEVAAVLREAPRASAGDLLPLVRRSADTGFFVAPIAVTDGTIKVSYDELQLLQVALQIAAPFSILEKRLKPVYDRAQAAAAQPDVISEAGLRSVTRELFQQFHACVRSVESGYLESETERVLLDRRAYKRRSFLDAEWLRAELVMQSGSAPIPTYLPAHLAQKLPLLASFHARIIIEVLPRQDHREQSPLATRVVALARLLRFEGLST
jgi:hypothetical protein